MRRGSSRVEESLDAGGAEQRVRWGGSFSGSKTTEAIARAWGVPGVRAHRQGPLEQGAQWFSVAITWLCT